MVVSVNAVYVNYPSGRSATSKFVETIVLVEASKQSKGESTMASKPTYEQAQLHLQIYEERREPRLRQARDWFFANCFADTLDEAMRIAPPGTEAGTNFMMVIATGTRHAHYSTTDYFTRICSSKPAASSSVCGIASSPPFRRAGNGSRTNSLPPTSKKQQTASKLGLKITHLVSSPLCARWTNKCAHRRKKRPKIGPSRSLTNQ